MAGGAGDGRPRPAKSWGKWLIVGAVGIAVVTAVVLGLVFGLPADKGNASSKPTVAASSADSKNLVSASIQPPAAVVDGLPTGPLPVTPSLIEGQKASLPTTAISSNHHEVFHIHDGNKQVSTSRTCPAASYDDLAKAIANTGCQVITLTGGDYVLTKEIVVTRSVTITGAPGSLPYIDARDAIRAFRVTNGGYLELRYVRILQGRGIIRPRALVRSRHLQEGQGELATRDKYGPDKMIEIRGGSVYFETGSAGGTFTGVVFVDDETSAESVEDAIAATLTMTGVRIYGGHVYIAGGSVRFILCLFWDFELFTTLSDRIYVGGDVLVLAGEADFAGCVWQYTTVIGLENGLGFNVAVFAGVTTFTGCYFQENNGAVGFNGAGQAFSVIGGVQVLTGVSFVNFSGVELFTGTGDFSVMGGVQIVTGMSINDFYAVLAAFGAGFDFLVGGGFTIHTGVSLNQWNGPMYNAVSGGYSFVGGGEAISIGSPYVSYCSVGSEVGTGGIHYIAAGIGIFIGSPIVDISGVFGSFILGEYIGVGGGFIVAIGCPYIEYSGVECFYGLGGTMFVGGGAAVLGYSPLAEAIGVVNDHADFWISGTCEPVEGQWAAGPAFFVPPAGICDPEAERRRALGGNSTQKVALVAADMKKIQLSARDDAGRKQLSDVGVPADTISALGRMEVASRPGITSKTTSASFHIQDDVEGYCGGCGASNLTGPGASKCVYEESCRNLNTPVGRADKLSLGELSYPESYVIMSDMFLRLPAASSKAEIKVEDLAKAVKFAMGETIDDPTDVNRQLALQVKVYQDEVDPHLSGNDPTPQADRKFKLVMVASQEDKAHDLIEKMQREGEAIDEGPISAATRARLVDRKGLKLEELSMAYERMLFVPAYNSDLMRKSGAEGLTDLGRFSVVAIDPELPSHPVTQVKFDKMYTVYLEHFDKQRMIKVSAVSAKDENIEYPLASAITNSLGAATVNYRFPAGAIPPGDYYLKGEDSISKVFGSSPVMAFSTAGRRRRLFGPLMVM